MVKNKFRFSRKEVSDLIISWLTISVAFAWVLSNVSIVTFVGIPLVNIIVALPITLVAVGTGFVFHELSHKYTAIRFGAKAEYRTWYMGLIFAAFLAFVARFIFAAPGAVYIFGKHLSRKENGLISLAGPGVNIIVAAVFYILSLLTTNSFLLVVLNWTVYINLFLAAFNLIPISPLDGSKVFAWDIKVWAAVFLPLVVLLFFFIGM